MSDFTVTPPNEWRKRSIMQVTLSNGLNVELRQPNLMGIVLNSRKGDVPHGLRQQIMLQLQGASPQDIPAWSPGQSEDELSELNTFMETVIRAAFVNPIIVEDPDLNAKDPFQIAYDWLDTTTVSEVFGLVMGGAAEDADGAATFPEGS